MPVATRSTSPRSASSAWGVTFRLATPDDDAALQALLRQNPMRGAISLSLERSPSYFGAATTQGNTHQTIVATNPTGQILCAGEVAYRLRYLNGRPERVGYLGALRLDQSVEGNCRIIRQGFAFFEQIAKQNPAVTYFTSIAAGNERARRLLERGLPGMPTYQLANTYTTFTLRTRRRRLSRIIRPATSDDIPAMLALLAGHAARRQLAPLYDPASLRLTGLSINDFLLQWNGDRLVAMAALWDQRAFKQTVIRGYSRSTAFARPFWNGMSRFTHAPTLPPAGSVLATAFVSHVATTDDDTSGLAELVPALLNAAHDRKIANLCFGFADRDPLASVFNRRWGVHRYASRLYTVHFGSLPQTPALLDNLPLSPEVALL